MMMMAAVVVGISYFYSIEVNAMHTLTMLISRLQTSP